MTLRAKNALRSVALGLFTCLTMVASAAPAHAGSAALWAERQGSGPALALVPNFSALAENVTPAVVSIQVDQKVEMTRQLPPGMQGGPFEFFFRGPGGLGGPGGPGGPEGHEFHNQGIGSGVVIREDGLVLTNYHVVENADDIQITFELADGTKETRPGKVLGSAPDYDVALVQMQDNAKVPFAYLGDSDGVKIGDWAMAIGTPFGLSHSVSVGIISAKDRRDIAPSGRAGLYDFLQTDASINPGNSGGPLINMRGEVIGINTAINASGSGIGFAIPINMVKAMLPQLKEQGKFARSYIGVKVQPLSEALAQSYNVPQKRGALVAQVKDNSPAAEAGVKEGDVIVEVDGKPVRQANDLPLYVSMAGVGKKIQVKVWRDGAEKMMSMKLAAFPDEHAMAAANDDAAATGEELGMAFSDLTPEMQGQLGLPQQLRGVVITRVKAVSAAARGGFRPGDVIVGLNGAPVKDAQTFASTVRGLPKGSVLRFKVVRQDGQFFAALRKP